MGRSYNDEQLFRIIVPKRFTLRRHRSKTITMPGFSETAILLNVDKRPEYSDADIVLVLQYRWPDQFAELKNTDIANVDVSVRGGGMHYKSGVDPLWFDDPTLSEYCHEKIYSDARKRAEILDAFKRELVEAKESRVRRIEELFEEFEPHILEYIFVARIYMAKSWDKIALSLAKRGKKPVGFLRGHNAFDGPLVKEIYQMHSKANTRVFDECVTSKDSVQKVMAALPLKVRGEHEQRSKYCTNKPAVLRRVLSKEPLDCHLTLCKTDEPKKRWSISSHPPATMPATKIHEQHFHGDFQLFD